jgi:hypothetical protein
LSGTERRRRPVPERTEPIRAWSSFLAPESASAPNGGDRSAPPAGESALPGAGAAVEMGYRVVEEYLGQGQRVATNLASQAAGLAAPLGPGLQESTERLLREGLLWWGQLLAALPGATPPTASTAKEAGPVRGSAELAVELSARCRASVRVSLAEAAEGVALAAHPLCAASGEAPPLTDVRVEATSAGPTLRVRIPDEQPPGVYSGVLYARASGEPCGTAMVRLGED